MAKESGNSEGYTRTAATYFGGSNDVDEFRHVLASKFGSVARAWRVALDADESGLLDFREFCAGTRNLGYTGNLRTLWYNLDKHYTGTVGLKELDPDAAAVYELFRIRCTETCGTVDEAWRKMLDQDASGFVSFPEFKDHVMELGYEDEGEIWKLFSLLSVKPGSMSIQYQDIRFLQKWDETKRERAFRKRVPVGWVNKDPDLHGRPDRAAPLPGEASDAEALFEAVSVDMEKVQTDFRAFLVERYGSLARAFDTMDVNSNGHLSLLEFQRMVTSVLRYCRPADARRLFLSFVTDPSGRFSWQELGVTHGEWLEYMLHKRADAQKRQVALHMLPGSSPRSEVARRLHVERLKKPKTCGDIAFWLPLPSGWGKPPAFEPEGATRVVSARLGGSVTAAAFVLDHL